MQLACDAFTTGLLTLSELAMQQDKAGLTTKSMTGLMLPACLMDPLNHP